MMNQPRLDARLGRRSGGKARRRLPGENVDVETAICVRIRAAVSAGDLPPGTKLPEEAVADSIAASRAQVRTAFQRLAFEGLLDLQKNRGAFVARPTVKEAQDVFGARRVIERVTTEIVTRTILTHQLRALQRQVADQKPHWVRANRAAAISGISAFHLSLAALAHNAALTTALERLILRTSLILGVYATTRTFEALPECYDLLTDLISSGQSLAAARQMERCLFAIEGALEFYPPQRRDVDVRRLMRQVG
jgi:DNA-binding GntR family transcriptional regulator